VTTLGLILALVAAGIVALFRLRKRPDVPFLVWILLTMVTLMVLYAVLKDIAPAIVSSIFGGGG
jgi:hypothetical protein